MLAEDIRHPERQPIVFERRTKDWAELAGCRRAHPPLEIGRRGQPEPDGGTHGPREASTKLQAGFVVNQDSVGLRTADIHWEGHSQRSAPQRRHMAHLRRHAHCTPRKPSGWDGGGDKSQLPKHLVTWAAWTGEGHKTQAKSNLWLCGVPENLNGFDLGNALNPGPASDSSQQSNLEPEQCRLGKHTVREWGQTHCGWDTGSTAHDTSDICLQCSSLPTALLNKWA